MQYEYAISDTAIAEKKLSLFAASRDAFTVVVVLHLEPSRKKVFLVALVMIILRSLEQSERDGLTATVIYIFEAFFCRIIALLYADNQVLRN